MTDTVEIAQRRRGWPLALVVLLLALLAGGGAWLHARRAKPPEPPARTAVPGVVTLTPEASAAAGIATASVKQQERSEAFVTPGVLVVDEQRTARIGSRLDAHVVRLDVAAGDRVARGQQLAQLHSPALHDAWAGYQQAKADLARRQIEERYATEAAARAKRLFDDRALSLQEMQRTETDRIAAAQEVKSARAQVERRTEELRDLGVPEVDGALEGGGNELYVRSPIAGLVLETRVTQGSAVTPGTPLFVVSDLSQLWAMAEVDEARLPVLREGDPVQVSVTAYPGRLFAGRVAAIGGMVDPRTRRVTVRCQLPNPDGLLKPEMYATIALATGSTPGKARPVLVVPSGSVQDLDGQPVVFVLTAPDVFESRPVEIGSDEGGWVEVRSGLREGETVASAGAFLLKSELLRAKLAEGD